MSTIKIKRSAIQGKIPLDADLDLGELAINTYDGKLFLKKSVAGANAIVDISTTNIGVTSNTSAIILSSSSGSGSTILGANSTTAGVITSTTQTIGGVKTFSSNTIFNGASITLSGLADTTTDATHYYVETSAGNILPKTLANVRSEIVTLAAVNATGHTHAFNDLTGKTAGTGDYTTTGMFTAATFNATSTVDGGFQGIASDTAAAPSFTWTGDLNTGMYRSAEGTVGISANGTAVATFSTTGIQMSSGVVSSTGSSSRDKLRVWNSGSYSIGMQNLITFGSVSNDHAMTFQMSDTASRGFWWGDVAHTTAQGAMSLSTQGHLSVANAIRVGYGESDTTKAGTNGTLDVNGNVSATRVVTSGVATSNNRELILFAGDSAASGYTGLTTENVYVVAEAGMQVISSSNNWTDATNGGWATANPAVIINNASGQSIFPGQVRTSDQFAANGATLNQLVTKRSGTYPTFILRNDGENLYFLKTAASSTISETYDSDRPLTINLSTGALSSDNGQTFSGGMTVNTKFTSSAVLEGPAGTAAQPGYTFSANNSVGIYLEQGALKFATSGVEAGYFGSGRNFNVTNSIFAGGNIVNSATLADGGNIFMGPNGTFGTFTALTRLGVYKNSTLAQPNSYIRLDEADGTTQYMWLDVSDQMRFSPTTANIGTTTGTLIGTQTSDERIKEIDPEFVYGIETVKRLKPMKYRLLSDPDKVDRLGFGAQTTREIVPEVVYDTNECIDGYTRDPNNDDSMIPNSDHTKLAMDGVQLIPVLTKALQESFEIIDSLKASISDLNMRIQTLETNSNK